MRVRIHVRLQFLHAAAANRSGSRSDPIAHTHIVECLCLQLMCTTTYVERLLVRSNVCANEFRWGSLSEHKRSMTSQAQHMPAKCVCMCDAEWTSSSSMPGACWRGDRDGIANKYGPLPVRMIVSRWCAWKHCHHLANRIGFGKLCALCECYHCQRRTRIISTHITCTRKPTTCNWIQTKNHAYFGRQIFGLNSSESSPEWRPQHNTLASWQIRTFPVPERNSAMCFA